MMMVASIYGGSMETVDMLLEHSKTAELPYLVGTLDNSLGGLANISLQDHGAREAFSN